MGKVIELHKDFITIAKCKHCGSNTFNLILGKRKELTHIRCSTLKCSATLKVKK